VDETEACRVHLFFLKRLGAPVDMRLFVGYGLSSKNSATLNDPYVQWDGYSILHS